MSLELYALFETNDSPKRLKSYVLLFIIVLFCVINDGVSLVKGKNSVDNLIKINQYG